jgi:hypothetical protein
MTPEAIEALALHRAAEVARKYADDCRADADDLISKGHTFLAQRETSAAADAAEIEGRILALAPVSPLQAALEVPEVRVMRKTLQKADDALTEAEAILGGEYGDQFGPLCEMMVALRRELAALATLEERT